MSDEEKVPEELTDKSGTVTFQEFLEILKKSLDEQEEWK